MFTGLVEAMGVIAGARSGNGSVELCVRTDVAGFDVGVGGSVAVDGVCLTLTKVGSDGAMYFTAVAETLGRTTFGKAIVGRRVNLERALRADGRLDGHFVLGHVDAVGRIVGDERVGVSIARDIEVPRNLARFMAEKGSVAVDGISLTIARVKGNVISLSLIPATVDMTTMSIKRIGDYVNIECDVLARYIYRMMETGAAVSPEESSDNNGETLIGKMERLGF
jgi:riboflavin synthase